MIQGVLEDARDKFLGRIEIAFVAAIKRLGEEMGCAKSTQAKIGWSPWSPNNGTLSFRAL